MTEAAEQSSKGEIGKTDQVAPASAGSSGPENAGTEKPSRPDEESFQKTNSQLEKELVAIQNKIKGLRADIEKGQGRGAAGEQSKQLRQQLDDVRAEQANMKGGKSKILEENRNLDESVKRKLTELREKQKRMPFKNSAEVDTRIAQLNKVVESGSLKLVEERKYLNEISQLKRSKKSFGEINQLQDSINTDKARQAELKAQLDDPQMKASSQKFNEIKEQLDKLRLDQDEAYKGQKKLYASRDALQKQRDEIYNKKKALGDQYYGNLKAFRAYEKEQRDRQFQKRKAEREAQNAERRKAAAEKRLEQASMPAYADEITTCQNLIRFFDPSATVGSAEVAAQPALAGKVPSRILEARTVEAPKDTQVLGRKNEQEDYFAASSKKKGGNKKGAGAKSSSSPENTKMNLQIGTINDLGSVGVSPPLTQSAVPGTVQALKDRMKHYMDNQEAETSKRVEKAKKEIEALERNEANKAPTNGTSEAQADGSSTDNNAASS